MHTAYLSLGSNLGDKEKNILRAVEKIQEMVGDVVRRSSFVHTEPWGFHSENMFVNAAICVETTLTPHGLLAATQQIERELGRTEKSRTDEQEPKVVYHDRLIDIDILLYDNVVVDDPDLKIPHPLMNERNFVMIPLKEILF